MLPYVVLISFFVMVSGDPEFIETVELSYGKYDAYFMSPLEMEEGKILSFNLFSSEAFSLKATLKFDLKSHQRMFLTQWSPTTIQQPIRR